MDPVIEETHPLSEGELLLAVVETVRDPFLILEADLKVRFANESFLQTFQVTRQETDGRHVYDLGNGQWSIPALRKLLEEILPQQGRFSAFLVEHDFPSIGHKAMLLHARQVTLVGRAYSLILLAIEDITEKKKQDDAIQLLPEAVIEVAQGGNGAETRLHARRRLDLEMHQPIQRDRRRTVAFDERVQIADVARGHRHEAKRSARVAPRQASRDPHATAIADALRTVGGHSLSDCGG